jgi:hypothetical protein
VNRFARALRDTARLSYMQSLRVADRQAKLQCYSLKCLAIPALAAFDSDVEIELKTEYSPTYEKGTYSCHCEECLVATEEAS